MTLNKMTQKIGLVNMKNTLFAGALGTLVFASASNIPSTGVRAAPDFPVLPFSC